MALGMTNTELRNLRRRLAWTQRQLADRLGVSQPLVHMWESGYRKIPERVALELDSLAERQGSFVPPKAEARLQAVAREIGRRAEATRASFPAGVRGCEHGIGELAAVTLRNTKGLVDIAAQVLAEAHRDEDVTMEGALVVFRALAVATESRVYELLKDVHLGLAIWCTSRLRNHVSHTHRQFEEEISSQEPPKVDVDGRELTRLPQPA